MMADIEYISNGLRCYWPDAKVIYVEENFVSEEITATIAVDGGYIDLTMKIGSDDDCFRFISCRTGLTYTIPFAVAGGAWSSDRYTDEQKKTIFELVVESIRDDVRETAADMVETMPQEELDSYVLDLDVIRAIHMLENPPEWTTKEELEAEIQCDTATVAQAIKWGYVEEIEESPKFRLTDAGRLFIGQWS